MFPRVAEKLPHVGLTAESSLKLLKNCLNPQTLPQNRICVRVSAVFILRLILFGSFLSSFLSFFLCFLPFFSSFSSFLLSVGGWRELWEDFVS